MVGAKTIGRLHLALRLAEVVISLSLPASVIYLWRAEPTHSEPPATDLEAPSVPEPIAAAHPLEWYAPLWERDWKQMPIPAAQSPVTQPTETGPVPVLLATLVEPQGRYAQLVGRSGRPQLRAPDETIDNFRVTAIEPGRVKLVDGGRTLWLEIPRNKDKNR